MNDGAIVYKSKIDNSGLQKDLNAAKREIQKSQKEVAEAEAAKLPLEKQAEASAEKLKVARQELQKYKSDLSRIQAVTINPASSRGDYEKATQLVPGAVSKVESQLAVVDQLDREWQQINGKVEKYNEKIAAANANIQRQKENAADLTKKLSSGSAKIAEATEKAQLSAAKFKKRLVSIAGQALVFSLISKALREVVEYTGKALRSNKEFTSELAKLKGALLTAFQPLYELILPTLMSLIRIATNVVTAIAKVAALLGGKSVSQYAESAKALYNEANAIDEAGKAAKKAQKSLAGFDEINRLGNNAAESEDSVKDDFAPDFSAFDTNAIKEQVDELTLFLSGALLLIGMVLALSGANIPLGLGLMAVGAIGLATEITEDWETVKKIMSDQAELILAVSSILLLIGMVLAFTGAAIPLGIGLMAAGAVGLASEAAVDWETVKKAIEENAALIAGISEVLFVAGLILALTGAALPLGIGLMAVGAAGFVSAATLNWGAVKEQLNKAFATLLAITSGNFMVVGLLLCLSGASLGLGLALIAAGIAGSIKAWKLDDNPITRFVKNIANSIIGIINKIIDAINQLFHLKFDGLKIGGVQIIPQIDTRLINIPKIPMLANGAVIPPNREFMAVLGDQRHGTNIEAPLSTIQEAVAEVMSEYEAANLAGHEVTAELLRQILSAVLGIEVGDTTIGKAANRYNEKMAIVRGRA